MDKKNLMFNNRRGFVNNILENSTELLDYDKQVIKNLANSQRASLGEIVLAYYMARLRHALEGLPEASDLIITGNTEFEGFPLPADVEYNTGGDAEVDKPQDEPPKPTAPRKKRGRKKK
jgi:hypothetical protein